MNIGIIGIFVIFGIFIVLLAANPRLSCFGRKLKSPLYPLYRKKKMEEEARRLRQAKLRTLKTEDYGFKLDDSQPAADAGAPSRPSVSEGAGKNAASAEDYGLKLD